MAGTFFGWDVAVLKTTSTGHDFLNIFTDCDLTLDYETDRSRAAHDLNPAGDGFDCDVQKSRSWGLRLGAAVENVASTDPTPTPCRRAFGWDLVDLSVGGTQLLASFTRCLVRISNETATARATHDTIAAAAPLPPGQTIPGLGGWTYPHLGHRSLEIDIDGVVATTSYFDLAMNNWGNSVAYTIAGAGITLAGDAIVSGGGLTIPQEGATQTIRLRAHGAPTTLPVNIMPDDPGALLEMAATTTVWTFQLTHPTVTNSVYQGQAICTEATFEAPDGAALQSGTFVGVGPLATATYP